MLRVRTVMTGVVGTPWYNNLNFFGDTEAQAESAVARVEDFWQTLSEAICTPITGVIEPEVSIFDAGTGQTTGVWATNGGSFAGIATGEMLPPVVQGLIRLRTGFYINGRALTGKVFVPGLAEVYSEDGVLSNAGQTILNGAAGLLLTEGTSELRVYSRTNGASVAVDSAQAWNQFAVLRSRRD